MMLHGSPLPEDQSPQSRWLDGNRGEFFFFPNPNAEYPQDELKLTEDERKTSCDGAHDIRKLVGRRFRGSCLA